ncbi:MAG: hypothetical protein DI552_00360 [Brevundimonas sp.]|uniref:hypothetical protein n=1 Tax=Brevundimonas sp. TaxID=1871086 RepID=UPI000DBBE93F|nr:hypothetical protein [Brevundimonas sp.]PZU62190.1 MAG: hypothetical protein DI552_00360 [Brevundimonas sp.]
MTPAQLQHLSREDLVEIVVQQEGELAAVRQAQQREDLQAALGVQPRIAWMIQALHQARTVLTRDFVLEHMPRVDQVVSLHPKTPAIYMVDVRAALGADSILTVPGRGWRLTPLGRLRVKRALGEDLP